MGTDVVHPGTYVVLVLVGGIAFQQSVDRAAARLSLGRGEQMLIELRDRLRLKASCPRCRRGGTPRSSSNRPAERASAATSWSRR